MAMDKVVLVTGASAGIGMATASALAAAGWTVVGASRRGTAADGWSGLMMDVDDDQSVSHGVASVLDRHGRLDALVTCAGWGLAGPVELTPIADAKAQEETNFWGSVRAVQAILPAMRESGSGRIILISSIGGVMGLPFQAFYSASKFAIEGFGETLAYEVAPFGIRVTLVEPGNICTEFTAKRRSVPAPVQGDGPQGPYDQAALKALSVMERDEQNGPPAKDVAAVIRKVLDARRPPRRVSVGKPSERIGVVAKKLLPFRVFEMAAKGSLGV
jgi:NAD(P)-dependent dehydrogenase (short-subunit alcohol dehydrogenase family)